MPKSLHSSRHMIIAAAIAEHRRAKKLTQKEVADVLGRHQPFIANIGSGERRVDLVELMQTASVVDLDIHALIKILAASDN